MEYTESASQIRLLWLVYAAAGGCGACVAFIVLDVIRRAREAQRIASREILVTETTSGTLRSFLPMARMLGIGFRGLIGRDSKGWYGRYLQRVTRRLAAAGTPQGLVADEYVGFMILWGLLGLLGGFFAWGVLELETMIDPYSCMALFALLGMAAWRSWLLNNIRRRQVSIKRAMPFAMDLLTLSVEAGLDFTSALGRIVKKIAATPLGREFSLMLHEIQLGKARSDAMRDFANRVDISEVRSVIASMIQAEELGASLGPILRIQAAQLRERRSQTAEEKAMKAPVKLLFPLLIFIFPTTLIILGAVLGLGYLT